MRPAIGFKTVFGGDGKGKPKKFKWDGKPKRCPKKGEYFLSGAIPAAYMAFDDMSTEYFICVQVKED